MESFLVDILTKNILLIIVFLLIALFLFFVFREIILWYFRINENTEYMRKISNSLERLADVAYCIAVDMDEKNKKLEHSEEQINDDEYKEKFNFKKIDV